MQHVDLGAGRTEGASPNSETARGPVATGAFPGAVLLWLGLSLVAVIGLISLRGPLAEVLVDWTGETEPREQVRALITPLLQPGVETADLAPIAHGGQPPFGANTFFEQEVDEWKLHKSMQMLREAGVHWVRQQMPWSDIEMPAKGQYLDAFGKVSWQKYDRFIDLANQYGLEILARLDFPPHWARRDNSNTFAPPDNLADYGDFVRTFVQRYRGKIRYYQIWNEPNTWAEWGPRPVDAAAYVELLKVGYRTVKEADPTAVVVAASLAPTLGTPDGKNVSDLTYLEKMYAAGAKDFFDVMSVMGYGLWTGPGDRRTGPQWTNFSRPRLIREIMVRHGDAHKPIWAAEVGWNALPADFPKQASHGRVSEENQARYTVNAYRRAMEEWPWMGVLFYWHFRPVHDENRDQVYFYFRMVDPDFAPHPVYSEYRELATQPASVPYGFHQEDHRAVEYSADWQPGRDGRASLGGYQVARAPGSRVAFRFRGNDLDLVAARRPGGARLAVTIDGSPSLANALALDASRRALLSLEAAEERWGERLPVARGLPDGEHRAELEIVEPGGPAVIDGFVVGRASPTASLPGGLGAIGAALVAFALGRRLGRRWTLALGHAGRRAVVAAGMPLHGARVRIARALEPVARAGYSLAGEAADPVVGRLAWPVALAVLLAAFGLRVYRLDGQSLWSDEGASVVMAGRSLGEIAAAAAADIHPPGYYAALHGWAWGSGTTEFGLRFLSVASGLLLVALVFHLGRRLFSPGVGLFGAAIAALSPLLVHYSQEMRMYAPMATLGALSTALFLRWLGVGETRGWRDAETRRTGDGGTLSLSLRLRVSASPRLRVPPSWTGAAYVLATAAALYTQYFALTVLVFQWVAFALLFWRVDRHRRRWIGWLGVQAAVGLLYLPWVRPMLGQYQDWPAISESFGLAELVRRVFLVFSFGLTWDVTATGKVQMLFAAVLALGVVALAGRAALGRRTPLPPAPAPGAGYPLGWARGAGERAVAPALFLLLFLLVPIAAMYLLSLRRPLYNPKFLLVAVPAYCLLIGLGIEAARAGIAAGVRALLWSGDLQRFSMVRGGGEPNPPTPFPAREGGVVDDEDSARAGGVVDDEDSARAGGVTIDHGSPFPRGAIIDHDSPFPGREGGRGVRFSAGGSMLPLAMSALVVGACLAIIGFAEVRSLRAYYFDPKYARDDYRGLVRFIQASARPGDAVVLNAPGQVEIFDYYDRGRMARYPLPRQRPADRAATERDLDAIAARHDRIWLVLWAVNESDPQGIVEGWLNSHGFRASHQWYGGVRLMLYSLRGASAPERMVLVRFGQAIELASYRLGSGEPAQPGGVVPLELRWRALASPGGRYAVFAHLVESAEHIWGQQDGEPAAGQRPTVGWRAGDEIEDRHGLPVLLGTPPGRYRVAIGLYDSRSGVRLPIRDAAGADVGDRLVLPDEIEIARPPAPPPPAALQVERSAEARWGELELLGYDFFKLGTQRGNLDFRAGELGHLTLYWRAARPADGARAVRLRLVGSDDAVVWERATEPADGRHPARSWLPGEVVRDQYKVPLTPGSFRLQIGVAAPAGPLRPAGGDPRQRGEWLELAPVVVRP